MIPKETEAEILRLFHAEKWRVSTIANQLALHHTTVQRVLRQTGVELKALATRPSVADTFVPFIIEQLEKYSDLCASRLFQMVKDRGYPGGPITFGALLRVTVLENQRRHSTVSKHCRASRLRWTGRTSESFRSVALSGRSGPS